MGMMMLVVIHLIAQKILSMHPKNSQFYFQNYFMFIIIFDPELCNYAMVFSSAKPKIEGLCLQGDNCMGGN